MNDNLDEYDFIPSASSNLANLFESSPPNLENSTLIYTAPKQPKGEAEHSNSKKDTLKAESSVVCACAVHVWKLVDNKYIGIGKHGFAIIGSAVQNTYDIILYKEKRNVIVRVKLSSGFELSLKKDDFASFYDGLRENWLVKFSNSDDCKNIVDNIMKFDGKVLTAIDKNEDLEQNRKKSKIEPTKDLPWNTDNSKNKAAADILSRIARMGQAILPNNLGEDDDESVKEYHKCIDNGIAIESGLCENQPSTSTTNVVQVPKQLQNIPNTFLIGQPLPYDLLSMYVTENRAHNSETRISLLQISEKLNHILKAEDSEKSATNDRDTLKSKIKVLDLRNENITRELKACQEENAQLKVQIKQKEMDIAENLSKLELMCIKDQEPTKIADFEKQIDNYKSTIDSFTEVINSQKSEINSLKIQLESCQNNTKMKDELLELENTIFDLKNKLNMYEKHENDVKQYEQENKEKSLNFTAVLKELMNEMYSNIIANFNEHKNCEVPEFNCIIAQNVKSTTLRIIQNFQNIYQNKVEI